MTAYKINNKWKKTTVEDNFLHNKDKNYYLQCETVWRTGEFIIRPTADEEIPNEEMKDICISDYEQWELWETWDGCAFDIYVIPATNVSMTEEEKKLIKDEIYEESNGEFIVDFQEEQRGWEMTDTEYRIDDAIEVEELTDG
mgnify:FL=1